MSNNNTTKTTPKVANRKLPKLGFSPRTAKAYTRKELLAEFTRLTGETFDPAYIADIANGTRINHRLGEVVRQAVTNLTKAAR